MNCEHYIVSNTNIEAYGLSITGQVRQANEDSCGFATVPNGELFVVCDGMGGHVGGATASRIAVEQIIQHFKAQHYPNIYQALHDALCRANIQIIGAANAEPSLKGMGTTACIVLVDGNDAYIAHVGDSRIYLYEEQKKRLFRITKDHSFVQSLVDMGQLDDRDAEHHPRKNVIMKALGIKEELKPEVFMSPVQPAKGDMFLICSDGLSGMVDDDGIEAILSSDQSVEQKVLDLVTNANVPGKGLDNITAQVIKVVESPYPLSNHPDHNPNWRKDSNSSPTLDLTKESDSQPVTPPKKKKVKLLLAILIPAIALMLLIGGGVAAYFIWWHGKEKTEEVIQTQQEASEDEVQQKDETNQIEEKDQQDENNKVEENQQDGQSGLEAEDVDQEKKTGKEVEKEDETKTEKETKSETKSKGFWKKKF
jgi:serine/threonine protein phosphatase PrpC